jgi:hypothetical protein
LTAKIIRLYSKDEGRKGVSPLLFRFGRRDGAAHAGAFPETERGKESVMLFVALGTVRAGTAKERMARRLTWNYPPGMKPVAEYVILSGNPSVISIAEADDPAPMMAAMGDWDDVISWTVLPAMTMEQSMEMAKKTA